MSELPDTGRGAPLIAAIACIALVAGVIAFGWYKAKGDMPARRHDRADLVMVDGTVWGYESLKSRHAEGLTAYDVILRPVRVPERRQIEPSFLTQLCGAILTDPPRLASERDRRRVFRVSLNIRTPDGALLSPAPWPIAVVDGTCRALASGQIMLPGYPGLMPEWAALTWTAKDRTLAGLRASFVALGNPDLDSFDPTIACRAALFDVLSALVAADPANEQRIAALKAIEIEARTVRKVMGVELGRYRVWSVPIGPQGCGTPTEVRE